jgi:SAM-dependent methyltransferase
MSSRKKIGINQALKRFGGFVRYFDTTEPLDQLAAIVSAGPSRDILACCGGGNQALTMLGAGVGIRALWAVDINPAQLFILAAKAQFLDKKRSSPFLPSFKQLQKIYPQNISAVKKDIRPLNHLYHLANGKMIVPPSELTKKYAVVHDDGIFILPESGPYWQSDPSFADRVRAGLPSLQFLRTDILDGPEYFKEGSLDLIYFSDIYWQGVTEYYVDRMAGILKLLRPNGRIIGYSDPGENFGGGGISPLEVLVRNAKNLALRVNKEKCGYLVIQREPKTR